MKPEELLKLTENTSTVAFHKFVLLCKDKESDLYCFFEGRDSQYYSTRIKYITKRKYHPITCGNKKNVLDVFDLFSRKEEYKKYSKAFFVDKDFDVSIENEDIYETPCYSVENFYVNSECLSEILKNEFALTEVDEEYKATMTVFQDELSTFSRETLLFNAWYASLKIKKHKEGLKSTFVSLEDKPPKEFICMKIGSITSSYDLAKIRQAFPEAIQVSDDEVMEANSILNCPAIDNLLRGKFQFSFFYNFLRFIIDDANNAKTIFKKKTKFNVDKPNMYTQLSQYAVTPDCLIKYLSRF